MDPLLLGVLGIAVFFVLLLAGVHIGFAMAIVGFVGLAVLLGVDAAVSTTAAGSFYFVTSPDFVVLPVFVLMGLVAVAGGLTDKTFEGLRRLLVGVRGGTGLATIGGSAAFGTIAGTSLITAMVFGKVASPAMRKLGYDKRLAYGISASGGLLGVLLPPSSFAVFYGLLTQESIAGLLMAGIGPGILLTLLYAAMLIFLITVRPSLAPRETERLGFVDRVRGLAMTWEVLLAFAVIIGGVIAGIFTVTESAGIGTLIILVMAAIRSKMDWRTLWGAFTETVAAMGMLFLLLAAARIFSKFIVASGLTQWVVDWLLSLNPTPVAFLFGITAMYIVLGTFMESLSILILTVPVLYPAVGLLGIDPLWFFAVVMISIELGLLTPPLGMNIFGVKAVAEPDVRLEDVQAGALPFALMAVLTAVIVILLPPIANWIPLHMAAP